MHGSRYCGPVVVLTWVLLITQGPWYVWADTIQIGHNQYVTTNLSGNHRNAPLHAGEALWLAGVCDGQYCDMWTPDASNQLTMHVRCGYHRWPRWLP